MALPLPPSLTPAEIGFLCEMESVTIIPRQRLEPIPLLSGPTPPLRPPHRANIPLWLAVLLKRQRRASIVPPPWMHPTELSSILEHEVSSQSFTATTPLPASRTHIDSTHVRSNGPTPPFQDDSTADAPADRLPYHFQELAHLLLTHAADDIPEAETVRRLLRDLREVRMAKVRAQVQVLNAGAGVDLSGIGATEVGEGRLFLTGVVDGLRKIGASRELTNMERAEEEGVAMGGTQDDEDEDML